MFWHGDDLTATAKKLLAMGASEHEPRTERKAGFATSAVVDPFSVLGVMQNAHLLHVLAARADA